MTLEIARRSLTVLASSVLVAAIVLPGPMAHAGQPAAGKSPGETYLAYRAAMLKAKSVENLLPWLSKEARAQIEESPKDERPMMFEFMQEMAGGMSDVKVVNESVKGDTATVEVEATDAAAKSKIRGKINMAREDGAWKVVRENWGSGA
jgi:hypothetical protein